MFESSLDSIYDSIGVDATLSVGSESHSLRVLDKTVGTVITVGDVNLQTVKPVCAVRLSSLAALLIFNYDELIDATLLVNGSTWTIINYKPMPTPFGGGELYLEVRQ